MIRYLFIILAFILSFLVKIGYFFATIFIMTWEFSYNTLLKLLSWARVRLIVQIIEDQPEKGNGHLQFEIENQSKSEVSLKPYIKATFWHPVHGKYIKASTIYDLSESDLNLPPFTPKTFSATARSLPRGFDFSWFRTYKFCPTKGPGAKVRIRNTLLEPMSSIQYAISMIKFRTNCNVKTYNLYTMKEFDSLRRTRGLH